MRDAEESGTREDVGSGPVERGRGARGHGGKKANLSLVPNNLCHPNAPSRDASGWDEAPRREFMERAGFYCVKIRKGLIFLRVPSPCDLKSAFLPCTPEFVASSWNASENHPRGILSHFLSLPFPKWEMRTLLMR